MDLVMMAASVFSLIATLLAGMGSLQIAGVDSTLVNNVPSVVTKGGFLVRMENVVLYTTEEIVLFTIPDIPQPSKQLSTGCRNCGYASKIISGDNVAAIDSVYKLMETFHSLFSLNGIPTVVETENPTRIVPGRFQLSDSDPTQTFPSDSALAGISKDDLYQILQQLNSRKFSTSESVQHRKKRFVALPVAIFKGALAASSLKSLFLPQNGILSRVLDLKNISPVSLVNLVKSSGVVPKLTEVVKNGLRIISNADYGVMETVKRIHEPSNGYFNSTTVQYVLKEFGSNKSWDWKNRDVYLFKQLLDGLGEAMLQISDNTNLLFTLTTYLLQLNSMQTCRDGGLPLNYVPPALLKSRLLALKDQLNDDLELAIPITDLQQFYTIKKTTCLFDVDGGAIELRVPVKEKTASYKLFQFKSLSFAWKSFTCDIGVDAGLIVVEENSKDIFPVSQLNEEECSPITTGMCRVPFVASNQWEDDYCVRVMLQGGTKEEVENACPLQCREGMHMTVSQIDEDVVVATHLPSEGARIDCTALAGGINYSQPIINTFETGALRIYLPHSCRLIVHSKIYGRSLRKKALAGKPLVIEHILPAHWINLVNWVVHPKEASSEMTFTNIEDMFDNEWVPKELSVPKPTPMFTYTLSIPTSVMSGVHTGAIIYLLYKINMLPVGLMDQFIGRAQAKSTHRTECQIPTDISVCLYIVVSLQIASICPTLLGKLWKKVSSLYDRKVEVAAIKKVQMQKPDDVIVF